MPVNRIPSASSTEACLNLFIPDLMCVKLERFADNLSVQQDVGEAHQCS